MEGRGWRGSSSTARPWRRRGRRLPWTRHEAVASAAALAALFSASACGSDGGAAQSTTSSVAPTSAPTTVPTTAAPTTSAPPVTSPRPTAATTPATASATTRPAAPATTATTFGEATCLDGPDGTKSCVIPGRPLRRRRRRRPLLPIAVGVERPDEEAGAEYASVAAFGELALRLLAVGAPAELVAACHAAALDEIRHAAVCDRLAGREPAPFGPIPGLTGHRLGGRRRSRRVQLRRLAVESFLDGWVNEGAAAVQLRERADGAASHEDRDLLRAMAEDEQRHADLARAIVTWCFDEDPGGVGRALGAVAAA